MERYYSVVVDGEKGYQLIHTGNINPWERYLTTNKADAEHQAKIMHKLHPEVKYMVTEYNLEVIG